LSIVIFEEKYGEGERMKREIQNKGKRNDKESEGSGDKAGE
jgi:hypothetical protein